MELRALRAPAQVGLSNLVYGSESPPRTIAESVFTARVLHGIPYQLNAITPVPPKCWSIFNWVGYCNSHSHSPSSAQLKIGRGPSGIWLIRNRVVIRGLTRRSPCPVTETVTGWRIGWEKKTATVYRSP